jgi:Fe2+ transport system protein FeoA
MTLEQIGPKSRARISMIDVGRGLRRRLEQMGLHIGDEVVVISRGAFRGPVLVIANGMQVALGRGVARKIEVVPIERSSKGEE